MLLLLLRLLLQQNELNLSSGAVPTTLHTLSLSGTRRAGKCQGSDGHTGRLHLGPFAHCTFTKQRSVLFNKFGMASCKILRGHGTAGYRYASQKVGCSFISANDSSVLPLLPADAVAQGKHGKEDLAFSKHGTESVTSLTSASCGRDTRVQKKKPVSANELLWGLLYIFRDDSQIGPLKSLSGPWEKGKKNMRS